MNSSTPHLSRKLSQNWKRGFKEKNILIYGVTTIEFKYRFYDLK